MSHKLPTLIDPTKRLPPTEYSSDARSRSRSRTRLQRSSTHDTDPLLSNLSPTSTLEALSYANVGTTGSEKDSSELQQSVVGASTSERALGIRAALAAKKLKGWHTEVVSWEWPNTTNQNGFEVPKAQEVEAGDEGTELGAQGSLTQHGNIEGDVGDNEEEYWGGLPCGVVRRYEQRIEAIVDEMEALDVEELKTHVLEAHIPSRSRSTSGSFQPEPRPEVANHNHLDDFTAVVTATIIRALPYVTRLNILLQTWTVRLAILRQVPGFLRALEEAFTAIASGWRTISGSSSPSSNHSNGISREAFNIMQPILEDRLTAAGRRLDRMLDALEGREDTVPTRWIDDMEMMETDYSNWVVEAEKKVLQNEWQLHSKDQSEPQYKPTSSCQYEVPKPPRFVNAPSGTKATSVIELPRENQENTLDYERTSQKNSEFPNTPGANDLAPGFTATITSLPDEEHSTMSPDEAKLSRDHIRAMTDNAAPVSLPVLEFSTLSRDSLPKPVLSEPMQPKSDSQSCTTEADSAIASGTIAPQPSIDGDSLQDDHPRKFTAAAAAQNRNPKVNGKRQGMEPPSQADSTEGGLPTDERSGTMSQGSSEPQPGSPISGSSLPKSLNPLSGDSALDTPRTEPAANDINRGRNTTGTPDPNPQSVPSEQESLRVLRDESTSSQLNHLREPTMNDVSSLLPDKAPRSDSPEEFPTQPPHAIQDMGPSGTVDDTISYSIPGSWEDESAQTPAMEGPARAPSPSKSGSSSQPFSDAVPETRENTQQNIEKPVADDRPRRPTPLTLGSQIINTDPLMSSDNSHPGSAASDFYSTASSPEIWDARAAQNFGKPVEVTSPTRLSWIDPSRFSPVSRSASQQTVRDGHDIPLEEDLRASVTPVHQRNRGTSFSIEPTIPEDGNRRQDENMNPNGSGIDSEMRRASIASIEVLSRPEVKSINVRRSGVFSPVRSIDAASTVEPTGLRTPTFLARHDLHTGLTPDGVDYSSPLSPLESTPKGEMSPLARKFSQQNGMLDSAKTTPSSLSVSRRSARPAADLNGSQGIRAKPWQRRVSDPLNDGKSRPIKEAHVNSKKSTEDQLEEKISSLLTTIPARIRLTSGPGPDAPEVRRPRASSGSKRPGFLSSALRSSRNSSEGPSLTLAPAFSRSPQSNASPGDPEIKLYHLHQAGKDVPIKLYVRLVGENGERVMVRVGGGWADLGEYLKEYANHHGRRSVSDGRFEIKGLPQGHSTSSITTLSGLANPRTTPTSRPASALGRPASALGVRRSRFASGSPADFTVPSTPDQPSTGSHERTPGSTESHNTSIRPSSRSSWTSEDAPLGLAGPKSRRIEVSPGKQAWVDGMMEQAKKASGEKKKPEESFFGDLGKIGKTNRVFMKSNKEV